MTAPWPQGEARWLTEVEVAWETGRRRFCDAACREVVLVEIVTWQAARTESRRVRHLYCERHGRRAAGLGGFSVPPRPAEDAPDRRTCDRSPVPEGGDDMGKDSQDVKLTGNDKDGKLDKILGRGSDPKNK